jgi:hypothetical protein
MNDNCAKLFFEKEEDQEDIEAVLNNLHRDGKLNYTSNKHEEPIGVKGKLYQIYAKDQDPMVYYNVGWLYAHLKKIRSAQQKNRGNE